MPFNVDKVMTAAELAEADPEKTPEPTYLKHPTVIFFNPNAQYYQQ